MPLSNRFGLAHGKKNILRDVSGSNVTGLSLVDNELRLTQSDNQPTRTADLSSLGGGGGSGIVASSSQGQLPFYKTAGVAATISGTSVITFNSTNESLNVLTSVAGDAGLILRNTNAASTANGLSVFDESNSRRLDVGYNNNTNESYIWSYAADVPLKIATNGTERMRILAGGNVGIGTTSPDKKLEVVGHISASSSTATNAIYYSNGNAMMYNNNTHHFFYGGDTSTRWIANDGSSTFMSLMNSGKLGIGTTSPGAKLDVQDDTAGTALVSRIYHSEGSDAGSSAELRIVGGNASTASLKFGDGAAYRYSLVTDTSDNLLFKATDTNTRMTLTSAGNVGIGTTTPSTKLDVNGDIMARAGNSQVGGGYGFTLESNSNNQRYGLKFGSAGNIDDSDDLMLTNREVNGNLLFATAGATGGASGETTRMVIAHTTGRVGINTTNPSHGLTVFDTDFYLNSGDMHISQNKYFKNANDGGQSHGFPSSGKYVFNNVDVGIGTSAPNSELDVFGDIRITNKNGSNPTDAGSLIFEESGDNWGSSLFGFRINLEGSSNYLNFQSANQSTIKDVLTLTRDTARVGIGTTSPYQKLDIRGNLAVDNEINFDMDNNATAYGYINWDGYQGGDSQFRSLWIGDGRRSTQSSLPLAFFDGTTRQVGIGTTTPLAAMHINASAYQMVFQRGTHNHTIVKGNSDDTLLFATGAPGSHTARFKIQPTGINVVNDAIITGNVGIGTSSPGETLHVAGTSRVTGKAAFGSSTLPTTTGISVSNTIQVAEKSSAPTHVESNGILWVKDDNPTNLYFTDDDGNDIALTNNGSAAGGDITAVTAGTNLNGGGSTGDVTLNLDTNITGDITFDTNVLAVDSSNNRVGIGTASPRL